MQQKASPAVIAAALVVLVAVIAWWGSHTLAKPSAGANPYANHKGPPPGMSGGGSGGPGSQIHGSPPSTLANTGGNPGGN